METSYSLDIFLLFVCLFLFFFQNSMRYISFPMSFVHQHVSRWLFYLTNHILLWRHSQKNPANTNPVNRAVSFTFLLIEV